MPDENLLSTFEQSLRQARATRSRLAARLTELEAEAQKIRGEIEEVESLANQTERAILRLLTSMIETAPVASSVGNSNATVSDVELEIAMRQDAARNASASYHQTRPSPQSAHHNVETLSERFLDRTIPQATTVLLRESGGPLHVNELHKRLLEGGFNFTGHNPTISIAVSLNRNRRFRKVAPGTFDLVIRDAAQAS